MPTGGDLGSVNTTDWNRVHELINRFEETWKDHGDADVDAFLKMFPPTDPMRFLALQELVKSDLEHRWQCGRGGVVEDYLRRFPELGRDGDVLARLLYEEYMARLKNGDKPNVSHYQARFPQHYEELKRRLEDTPVGTEKNTAWTPGAPLPPPKEGAPLPVGGGYRLLDSLGKGQFGQVFRAEAPGGKLVAIKVISWPLNHPAAQRELQSLEVIKRVDHPYLLDIHAFFAQDDRLIIVMGLAEKNLRDRLKECQRQGEKGIPGPELLRFMHEAAEALDFLHSKGIHHRDIKPGNILISGNHVRIGDLGLARLLTSTAQENASILGTPPYMPPEVWQGTFHTHTDQYSLAITYLELRRGRCPFRNGSMEGLLLGHLEDSPVLATLSEAERRVLLRAGHKNPDLRYPSCQAFADALAEALTPPKPAGAGYRKIKKIGKGTFGEVWRGEAPGGIPVAIKVIPLLEKDKVQSELNALELIRRLDHPNLVSIHAFWLEEEELHIAMTLADRSLRDLLNEAKRRGREGIPLEELLPLMFQSAKALDYLHQKGVIHRDIKPENILLKDNRVRVADFGVARMLEQQQQFSATTTGTMPYMPPEVWLGKTHEHSDQYSLAATYVELRVGRSLFKSDSLAGVMQAHLHAPPPLDMFSPAEQEVLKRALAKKPDERWPSCEEFFRALAVAINPGTSLSDYDSTLLPPAPSTTPKSETPTPSPSDEVPAWKKGSGEITTRKPVVTVGPSTVPAPPASRVWWGTFVAAAGGLILIAAGIYLVVNPIGGKRDDSELPGPKKDKSAKPNIRLKVFDDRLTVHAGQELKLKMVVEHPDTNVPVRLKIKAPAYLDVKETVFGTGKELQDCTVSVTVPDDLPFNDQQMMLEDKLQVQAYADDLKSEWQTVAFSIKPLSTLPYDGEAGTFQPSPKTKIVKLNGSKYYQKVDLVLHSPVATRIRFLLIPRSSGQQFYIMQDKVWYTLFAMYAKKHPDKVGDDYWKQENWTLDYPSQHENRNVDLGPNPGQLPALAVRFVAAHNFAHWLGGKLPTVEQWDAAGGKGFRPGVVPEITFDLDRAPLRLGIFKTGWSQERKGPYLPGWDQKQRIMNLGICQSWTVLGHRWFPGDLSIFAATFMSGDLFNGVAVGRPDGLGPLPIGTAGWDVSPWGCRDMAGNGCEWTRSKKIVGEIEDEDIARADPNLEVRMRGARWDERGLLYQFPTGQFDPHVRPPFVTAPPGPNFPRYCVGFRVIVEPGK
jgi:serine/threonine protein kinase